MSSMTDSILAARASARKIFGDDIEITVARAPFFGSDDVCIIVSGAEHAAAARSFMRVIPSAKVTEQFSCGFMGENPYTYSVIEWEVREALPAPK